MLVPMPTFITQRIAESGLQRAREYAIMRGWKSADRLTTHFAPGEAGIRSTVKYLIYQDRGTKSFLMIGLEGKTIPIRNNNGDTSFIKVVGVGTSGWVTIPGDPNKPKNQLYSSNAATPGRMWRDQKWRHPGIKPTHFLRNAMVRSVVNSEPLIRNYLKENVLGGKKK